MLGEVGTGDDLTTPRLNAYKLTLPTPIGLINDVYDARPAARHNGMTNVAFMDGHVKTMRMEQFYLAQTPPDKWFSPQGF